ncbi:gluconokinase [Pararhizobium haloflavum]|uniref:gluconokinase n=1 Tax=Pararhizobium haloflavum TaxID=2037914 RepID=UPI000C19BDDD|nr:gluconokinase [Pararhizobium haloflavum]
MAIDPFLLVMGVSGTGKSAIAAELAKALDGTLVEADALHSRENIKRMAAGLPLTDALRLPWLRAVADAAIAARGQEPVVIACSALKRAYREVLRSKLRSMTIVYLTGERDLIFQRMRARSSHFMPASLLDSQIADLEPPVGEREITMDVALLREAIVEAVLKRLNTDGAG